MKISITVPLAQTESLPERKANTTFFTPEDLLIIEKICERERRAVRSEKGPSFFKKKWWHGFAKAKSEIFCRWKTLTPYEADELTRLMFRSLIYRQAKTIEMYSELGENPKYIG